MAKVTMEQYGKIAADVLALPRRTRDMLQRALELKAVNEDAKKAGSNGDAA